MKHGSVSEWQKLTTCEGVVSVDVDGETVLLNVANGIYYGLSALATEAWRAIRDGATQQVLHSYLLQSYDVEPERLRVELSAFLESMLEHGILRLAEGK